MPMVTEPVQSKLTETPLEPIGSLDTKVVQNLVISWFFHQLIPTFHWILAENDGRLSSSCLYGHSRRVWYEKSNFKFSWKLFSSQLVPAEIVSIREHNGVSEYYIHYVNYNRRLDEWVTVEKMNLKELAPPASSSSSSATTNSSSSNNLCQEMSNTPQSRTVPSSTTAAATTSSETPAGITTTFFLSDDADSLNSDLSQTAKLPSLTNTLPTTPAAVVPTKIRGNGNNHGSGAHSVTKVKNIDLIHLGRYFIKPWYFSPYPEVNFRVRFSNWMIFYCSIRNLPRVRLFIFVNFVWNIASISKHWNDIE